MHGTGGKLRHNSHLMSLLSVMFVLKCVNVLKLWYVHACMLTLCLRVYQYRVYELIASRLFIPNVPHEL